MAGGSSGTIIDKDPNDTTSKEYLILMTMPKNIFRPLIFAALSLLLTLPLAGQGKTPSMTREQYISRYNTLVKNLGPAGVGIETLLDKWDKDYPDDCDQMVARFAYYFSKSTSSSVEKKDRKTFLGGEPLLTMQDSLGNPVYYFEEMFYDDELFGQSLSVLDKAIGLFPDKLDLRFEKINALSSYEKENPEMAVSELSTLIDYFYTQHPTWTYPDVEKVDASFFASAIQAYCVSFYRNASPTSYEAFRSLSRKMVTYEPKNVLFLDNLATYDFVVKGDNKSALKQYDKVLKIKKDDQTAIKNCILVCRKDKNTKLEKKYLEMMVKYGATDQEKTSAQLRLDFLNGKR